MKLRSLIRTLFLSLLVVTLSGILAVVGAYFYVARTLPKVDSLADYRPPIISRAYSAEGEVIAEYYKERRIVVPVSRMPKQLIQSFVSAEDAHFFSHAGIDFISILRAAIKNVQAGRIAQGGSTITQQVAKSLLLTPEKKFSRKFKEAILAWRMEQRLSKEEILFLYLNQIFLGHGAYGVQAAAENYFDKNVEELTLAECSMLAGLPQAPSRYSPYRHYARAKERQKYVLGRLVEDGFITTMERDAALAEELTIHPRVNTHIADAAYFTEQVRRDIVERYGKERLYNDGLQIQTTMSLSMQQSAQEAVRTNLRNHDKRQGFRGPLRLLSEEEEKTFLAEQEESFTKKIPSLDSLLEAVVASADSEHLTVRLGARLINIPLKSCRWATPLIVTPREIPPSGNANEEETHLPIGAVVQVRLTDIDEEGNLSLKLEQEPLAQGAFIALDPTSGQVRAMVGGYDFYKSQFNRALQAKRLPGSAIKPLIYAAALDKGYTPATIVLDTPLIYKETSAEGEETEWKPKNYSKSFHGATSVRTALTRSHNIITIKILEDIGIGYAASYISKLGITSPIARDLTLALGSSALTPLELATAYTVFASGGVKLEPTYITTVRDRDQRVLESLDPADFPDGLADDQRLIEQRPKRVISAETAYLVTNMMESVVQNGTGFRAKALRRPAAGKTGTTNDLKDAWFVGFIPQLVAVSWTGYDQERPLGDQETGSRAAAPAWVNFMKSVTAHMESKDFTVPDSIEFYPVDPQTGLLAIEDTSDVSIEVFAPGTAPSRYAIDEREPQARDFFRLDMELE